jgi:large subunit ribosomal protein L14
MVYVQTRLRIADNSGGRYLKCIRILKGSERLGGKLSDMIVVVIKRATPNKKVKKGEIYKAIIVQLASQSSRYGGMYIRFGENCAVLLTRQQIPIANRIFGPIALELRAKRYLKLVSMAPFVV